MRRILHGTMVAGCALALLGPAAPAAEDPKAPAKEQAQTQTLDVGGLTFQAPASWTRVAPRSQMRRAQLVIPKAEGDQADGELVVFVFPGGAGTVDENVTRWRNQFRDESGNPPEVGRKTAKGKNVEVTRVELAGTYSEPFTGRPPMPGARLLGAIVVTPQAGYFLKLVGPEKTVKAVGEDFDRLIASMTKTEG